MSSPESWIAPHVPASVVSWAGISPSSIACWNGLHEERREHVVLLAGGLDVPLAAPGPVLVGLRVGLARLRGRPACRRPRGGTSPRPPSSASFGVWCVGAPARSATSASPVASITRRARIASRPAFDSVTMPVTRVAVHDRRHEQAVEHPVDARLLDHAVGDDLEALGVELVRERLALGHGGAHLDARGSRTRARCRSPRPCARGGTTPCPRRRPR